MACEVLRQYSKDDYFNIYVDIELAEGDPIALSDVFESLHREYERSVADAIQEAIESGVFNENWDMKPGTSPSPVQTQFNVNGAKNSEAEPDRLSDYYYNKKNGYVRLSNMTSRFFEDIISRTLFDKTTGGFFRPTTSSVNQALYDYKVELLNKLWAFTGKPHQAELVSTDNLTLVISRTLSDFTQMSQIEGADAVWDDYIILKQFDKLLNDYAPFIKKDAAFENTSYQSKSMYRWDPSGTYRQSWTDSEDSDISKTTSPLVRLLADYFTCADANGTEIKRPIGFTTFNIAMATLARWLHENRQWRDVENVSRDIRKNGLSADLGKAIDVYIQHANPNDSLKEVLYGIKKHVFNKNSAIPLSIKQAFANQFFITAKYSYMAYRQAYSEGQFDVSGQYLEDSFINIKTANLMRTFQNKIWFYQWRPESFARLKTKHGIVTSNKDGIITIKFDGAKGWGDGFKITVTKNGDGISINKSDAKEVRDDMMISLIQDTFDTLIPFDYQDVLDAMSISAPIPATLFNTFIEPIALMLAAADEGKDFPNVFSYNEESDLINTYNFQQRFVQPGKFQSIVDGINDLNVLKNGEGNNLPIYQLAPAIFDIFTNIDEIADAASKDQKSVGAVTLENTISKNLNEWWANKEISSVFGENLFVRYKDLLSRIIVRSDVKIGNVMKSSDKLTASEVASVAIFNDFYQNLVREPDTNNSDVLSGVILIQPITFSDKKTHFLPAIDLSKLYISGTNALDVFKKIVRPDQTDRDKYIQAVQDEIARTRREKAKAQIYNQYLRFRNAIQNADYASIGESLEIVDKLGRTISNVKDALLKNILAPDKRSSSDDDVVSPNADYAKFDPVAGFKVISKILSNLNQFKDPIKVLRAIFKSEGTLLNEDFDVIQLKNGDLQANESLYFAATTYTSAGIKNYLNQERIKFAFDLQEYGVTMDVLTHPELRKYIETFPKDIRRLWYDPHSKIMRSFRIFQKGTDGKLTELFPTQAEFENDAFKHRTDLTVQLNPMIEGFFLANSLFGSQFNDVMFGGTEGYIPKYSDAIDFNNPDQSIIGQMMASRLANEFKRTTYGGAVKRKFATGTKFGVANKIRFAIVEDNEPKVSTLRGDTEEIKAQDGAGWVLPFLGRMINKSLIDSPVGDVRKTIAGWVDPRMGTQIHFKWAETTITADMRQKAQGDGSAEVMYRKGTSVFNIADKFAQIKDLSRYYNPQKNAPVIIIDEEPITRTNAIYRYDLDSGQYWKLEAIRNKNGMLESAWSLVDKKGALIYQNGRAVRRVQTSKINTLYDLDQALGGAFVYELDENGDMVTSEGVHDILTNIICTNNMKEDFIGYIVNHSAAKAGAVNVNDYSTLNDDDTTLNHHYLSASGIGVQMDADHEMDFASVTEMSQMVSLLTQSGTNIELVNQIYSDIGKVATEAMRDILAAVETNNADIYRIIGKALLDTFDSTKKEEIGLAQAFIKNAQNAILKEKGLDNIILPYSAESVKGSFVAAVTSLINKKGIKRKYAGFGGVQVPADKTMQHYRYIVDGNEVITDYVGLRDRIRPILQREGITWEQASTQQIINGKTNPFLIPIAQKDVQFEDTVVYKPKGFVGEGTVLKIQTAEDLDLVHNLLDPNVYEVSLWTIRPRELAQSDIRFNSDFGKFSEYDIDAIRASFYLNELIEAIKKGKGLNSIPFLDRKLRVLNATITDSDLMTPDGTQIASTADFTKLSTNVLTNLKKVCVHKAQEIFRTIGKKDIPVQMSMINDDLMRRGELVLGKKKVKVDSNYKNHEMQVVIGRRNFAKFGIRKGDKLADIKQQGYEFFYIRLLEATGTIDKVKSQVPTSRYDGIFQLSNGENMLVLVGDQSENLQHFSQSDDFVISDNAVSYKGQIIVDNTKLKGLAKVTDFNYFSYVNDTTGELMPVIMIPSYDVFDRIANSESITSSLYVYNGTNWFEAIKHKYASHFKQGKLIEDFTTDSGVKISSQPSDTIYEELNKNEHNIRTKALKRKADVLYRNFLTQLNYIQTRIPSQAMQSTANIEVIDFADTDTNYIWVPKMIFELQGSDLDIDKAYCMGYDVDDSGNIYAMSDLIYKAKYDVDDILSLPKATYGNMLFNSGKNADVRYDVTADIDEIMINGGSDFKILKYLIGLMQDNQGKTVAIQYAPQSNAFHERIERIVKDVNIHEDSWRSESEIEHALRNQVLSSARRVMNNPASQLDAYTPIAMKEPRDASKLNTTLGSKEKEMTTDNPMSIFIMQIQNMSGKEVIAMTATGIKSYFMVTTYFNTLAKQIERDLEQYIKTKDVALMNNIVSALNEMTFNGKLDNSEVPYLYTFANINFAGILDLINSDLDIRQSLEYVSYTEEPEITEANSSFGVYAKNGTLALVKLIEDLNKRANGNVWQINGDGYEYFVVNAPDSLSALLSAATDNAKELILDKLNATSKFADIYTTLLSQGVPFIKIAQMMTNSAFRIVAKYSQGNIFDPNTSGFRVQTAINFVLNKQSLPNIGQGLFEKFLTDNLGAVGEHRQVGFLKKIFDDNLSFKDAKDKVSSLPELIYEEFLKRSAITETELLANLKDKNLLLNTSKNSALIIDTIIDKGTNSQKNEIARIILDMFSDTEHKLTSNEETLANYLKRSLLQNLQQGIQNYAVSTRSITDESDQQYDPEPEYDPIEALMDIGEDDWEDMLQANYQRQGYWHNDPIRANELTKLYRYAVQYFIPKTELWNALDKKEQDKAKIDFEKLSSNILYATQEMRILGSLGSINQGLKPRDFDEYKFAANIAKFINQAYISRGKGEINEEFDLFKYLSDKEYHNRHVAYYDKVKSSVNILRALDATANFKEMFNYVLINRKMIERSAAIKIERSIAKSFVDSVSKIDTNSGINRGSTLVLNDQEFKILSQYVRDSIVYNFFRHLGGLQFNVPTGEQYYKMNGTTTGEPDLTVATKILTCDMSNIHSLATFKHLMDWYIIPKLQIDKRFANNAFIKNLTRSRFTDEKTRKAVVSFKVNVPLANIDSSPKAKAKYSDVLAAFNDIFYMPLDSESASEKYNIGNWTIGNLFFIYNLLVNKDRVGANAMTRLFEDLISSGNSGSLPAIYYKYISDLDTGKIPIFKEDGSIDQDVFVASLNDLKYRLSGTSRAKDRFEITERKKGKVVKEVNIGKDVNTGEPIPPITPKDDVNMVSDYILGLPFAADLVRDWRGSTHNDYAKGFNSNDTILASSKTVFDMLTQELADTYGKHIPIGVLTEKEMDTEFADRSQDERDAMKESTGFIVDGNIYLNGSKNSLDAPMHEIMHFIAAAMKFSKDPKIRSSYYKLLDWVTDWLDGRVKSGNKDDARLREQLLDKSGQYGNRHMSDIKEEILVTLLAREFKSQFNSVWGESRKISSQLVQANVKQTIASVLKTDKVLDLDFNELGNATLGSVLQKFASQILSADSTLLSMAINQNQEMADLKNLLVKGGFIELSEDCL